ncbi:MAG: hypothetical protein ACYCQJ_03170 [Nitrososphaerales archaeon]
MPIDNDIVLLKEYGFKKRTMRSVYYNRKKIDKFGMRQLDRLKMLLLRKERLIGNYPKKVKIGIKGNDLASFAEALALLQPLLKEKM